MITIRATTIGDAWHQLIFKFTEKTGGGGYKNTYVTGIDSGSYGKDQGSDESQQRIQCNLVAVEITHPETRPLAIQYPESSSLPLPNTEAQIEQYFVDYLAGKEVSENETYTYGSRMRAHPYPFTNTTDASSKATFLDIRAFDQIQWVIDHFKKSPANNHCCVQIATGYDFLLKHAPCLRSIDFKIVDGKLNMTPYFRSWDLFAGFPTNMGGLQLFNEYIAQEIGISSGKLFCVSSGLHIYSMYLGMVATRKGE